MPQAVGSTLKGDPAEEEDDEDDVGEGGCDVDDFPGRSDSFYHAHVDENPGDDEGERDFPVESFGCVDVGGDHEGGAVPEVLGGAADDAFGFGGVGAVGEVDLGAFGPRELRLETLDKVEEAPGDDGVVVEGYVKGDHGAADTNTCWRKKN